MNTLTKFLKITSAYDAWMKMQHQEAERRRQARDAQLADINTPLGKKGSFSPFAQLVMQDQSMITDALMETLSATLRGDAGAIETLDRKDAIACVHDLRWAWQTAADAAKTPAGTKSKTALVDALFGIAENRETSMEDRCEALKVANNTFLSLGSGLAVFPLEKARVSALASGLMDEIEAKHRTANGWTRIHGETGDTMAAAHALNILVTGGYRYERADFDLGARFAGIMENVSGWGNRALDIARQTHGRQLDERFKRAFGFVPHDSMGMKNA
ncbi:MAG: hypothetical protein H6865_00350 [Rhodospirillales bacterium]|nr:hypothetical protein [Alphaproteobacteria bacterium]MCB9986076.1 hypothetical protein [Rhodospirillales bacterium]USO07357.1 MAG: hypothetical protein H6866_08025 [Rhodospirillales bacterium]